MATTRKIGRKSDMNWLWRFSNWMTKKSRLKLSSSQTNSCTKYQTGINMRSLFLKSFYWIIQSRIDYCTSMVSCFYFILSFIHNFTFTHKFHSNHPYANRTLTFASGYVNQMRGFPNKCQKLVNIIKCVGN